MYWLSPAPCPVHMPQHSQTDSLWATCVITLSSFLYMYVQATKIRLTKTKRESQQSFFKDRRWARVMGWSVDTRVWFVGMWADVQLVRDLGGNIYIQEWKVWLWQFGTYSVHLDYSTKEGFWPLINILAKRLHDNYAVKMIIDIEDFKSDIQSSPHKILEILPQSLSFLSV